MPPSTLLPGFLEASCLVVIFFSLGWDVFEVLLDLGFAYKSIKFI